MKRVKVLIPFHNKDTQVNQLIGDIIEVSDEKLASIRKVNVNMVHQMFVRILIILELPLQSFVIIL